MKLEVNKFNPLFSKMKKITFVAFDFDGTLGECVGANTYIKRLVKKKDEVELGHQYKIVINDNKILDDIKTCNNVDIIQEVKIEDLEILSLEKNEHIKLTKWMDKEKVATSYERTLKNISGLEFQMCIVLPDGSKKYCTKESFNPETLNDGEVLKIDIRSKDLEELKEIIKKRDRIQKISEYTGKDIKEIPTGENIKIMTKKLATYEEIVAGNVKFDTIEQYMKKDPVSYNHYIKHENDLKPDYSDFRNAEVLRDNTSIFEPVKQELLKHHQNGHITTILTARSKTVGPDGSTESGKKITMDFLNNQGIPIGDLLEGKIHFIFSSAFEIDTFKNITLNKLFENIVLNDEEKELLEKIKKEEVVLKKLVFLNNVFKYRRVEEFFFYEDNKNMLKGCDFFCEKIYPEIKTNLKLVVGDGKILDYKDVDNNTTPKTIEETAKENGIISGLIKVINKKIDENSRKNKKEKKEKEHGM